MLRLKCALFFIFSHFSRLSRSYISFFNFANVSHSFTHSSSLSLSSSYLRTLNSNSSTPFLRILDHLLLFPSLLLTLPIELVCSCDLVFQGLPRGISIFPTSRLSRRERRILRYTLLWKDCIRCHRHVLPTINYYSSENENLNFFKIYFQRHEFLWTLKNRMRIEILND